jgi:hypothetical protein
MAGRRSKMKDLKAVPEDNKGLGKLPKDVRNRMGYMKKGGKAMKEYSTPNRKPAMGSD